MKYIINIYFHKNQNKNYFKQKKLIVLNTLKKRILKIFTNNQNKK